MLQNPDWHMAVAGWISLLAPVALGAVAWLWWSFAKMFVRQEECAACRAARDVQREKEAARVVAVQQAQQQIAAQLDVLELSVNVLPKAEDINRLNNALTALQGSINTMGKHIDGSVATLDAKVDALNANVSILLETHVAEYGNHKR